MARRYVEFARGDDSASGPASPFTSRSHPARSIRAALDAAQSGDVIEILDTHRYAEGELLIRKDVTLVSAAWRSSPIKPRDRGFRASSYPRIAPREQKGRVLRVEGRHLRRVRLTGLVIEGGRTVNDEGDPAMGAGAGVAVVDMGMGQEEASEPSGLLIEDCLFRNNVTRAHSSNQTSAAGLGRLFRTRIEMLITLLLRVPLVPDDVRDLLQRTNTALPEYFEPFNRPIPNWALGGQSFGAGLGFVWASGHVVGCRFINNRVTGRGGGIGVSGYGWPLVEDCVFEQNRAVSQTRRDGGGMGLEITIPDRLTRDLKVEHLIADLEAWLSSAGLVDAVILNHRFQWEVLSYLYSLVTDGQPVPSNQDEVIGAMMYLMTVAYLRHRRDQLWDGRLLRKAHVSQAVIRRCTFERNEAADDGGALYASVLSRIVVEDSYFIGNRAGVAERPERRGGGGALRATMGSDTVIRRCTFTNNIGIGQSEQVGGGALAFRNVAVTIAGSATRPTFIAANHAVDWAGGGVMISSESSGGGGVLPDWFPDYFTAILIGVYDFEAVDVHLNEHVIITGNRAGRSPGATGGKGGGLYILRGKKVDVRPLHLVADAYAAGVHANTATTPDQNDTVDQILLVDLAQGVRFGDRGIRQHLRGGRLRYDSG